MKRSLFIALAVLVPFGVLRAASLELPAWENATVVTTYHLGGELWPQALLPSDVAAAESPAADGATVVASYEFVGPPAPGAAKPPQFYGPAEGGPMVADASLQRVRENPDGTFTVPEEVVEAEVEEPLPPLEGELADLYFAHAPIDFLIDPQRLLTEQKSNDIMRFLEFHADESEFRVFVMVIGDTQTVPEGVDLQALHKQWFGDSPTVLMLYYREKPERTELVFNESVRSALPKSVFDRILQSCLREGAVADLAPDQVEKMAIELSIQLYWLSRLMKSENKNDQSLDAASTVHELMASRDAPELLREYAPGIFIDESGKTLSVIVTFVFVLGALAVIGSIAWIAMWWRGRETVSGEPLLFPEFRISRRLGGEFCGGGFASMSFEFGEGAS